MTGRAVTALAYPAVAVVVALVGFRLGAGDVAGAAATAVAGCPLALLAAAVVARLPRPAATSVRAVHLLAGSDRDDLLRLAAALHAAARPVDTTPTAGEPAAADAVSRAVVAAAVRPLPGVSDLDGTAAGGLRGVVSELVLPAPDLLRRPVHPPVLPAPLRDCAGGPVVVAHAVLVGPAGWAAAHGVHEPPGLPADALVVAWDGAVRGAVEVGPGPARPPAGIRAAAAVGAVTAAAGGLIAPLLVPAVVTAWPVVAVLVAAVPGVVLHATPLVATNG